ncbi:MAG: serine/threonine protein kinase, partial [Proteobacteria bacterium]|nr:serine/threonine protein kinase [Pseudomonadota bacterium]
MQTLQYNNIPNVNFSNASREEAPKKAHASAQQSEPKPQGAVITPPSLSDRYCFKQIIGRGTQGTVYRAKRLKDGTDVAIKQLNVHSVKTWKEYELFHREASVLESLDIRGIARFYEAIDCLEDEPPCSYIVQEWIKGKSVQQMLNEGHRFTMTEVYDILIQTLEILKKLHRHEPPIIHRDIKPSNLMLTPSETNSSYRVTLIDFGAVANPQVQGGGSTMAGTYGYMPPEQLMGAPTPACDIYALAAVGVQLFTGIAPTNLPTKDFTLIFEPEMQSKPHELVSLLRQMLNPKAEDRLTDIQAIIDRLEQFKIGNYKIVTKNTHTLGIEYEDKLHELTSVFDPGAIELWKDLPDASPRIVPFAYQQQLNNETGSIPAELRQQIIKRNWSVLFQNYIRPACTWIIIFILCFLMLQFCGWTQSIALIFWGIIFSLLFSFIIFCC